MTNDINPMLEKVSKALGNVPESEWRKTSWNNRHELQLVLDYSSKQVYAQKATGYKFAARAVADGVRIWRTA